MDGLMLHCGGKRATRKQITAVMLPEQTDTYIPVAHNLLVDKVVEITTEVLPVQLEAEAFGLARDGDQMFAHLRFKNGQGNKEMGLCVGLVNSYNKSLQVRLAAGASIFVCDNLMLAGGITYARRHTLNVWEDLEEAILERIAQAELSFETVVEDAKAMGDVDISNLCAYRVLGELYGERLLTNPMMSEARSEWEKPAHDDFKPRTKWSLYNAITASMKRTPPGKIMENHQRLHEYFNAGEFDSVAFA